MLALLDRHTRSPVAAASTDPDARAAARFPDLQLLVIAGTPSALLRDEHALTASGEASL